MKFEPLNDDFSIKHFKQSTFSIQTYLHQLSRAQEISYALPSPITFLSMYTTHQLLRMTTAVMTSPLDIVHHLGLFFIWVKHRWKLLALIRVLTRLPVNLSWRCHNQVFTRSARRNSRSTEINSWRMTNFTNLVITIFPRYQIKLHDDTMYQISS